MMRSRSYRLMLGVLGGLSLVTTGCQAKNVHIVKAPFVSPYVVPAPDVFRMNVVVKNEKEKEPSPDVWLRVYSEYWPKAEPAKGEPPCSRTDFVHVGVLQPQQSSAVKDYQIDDGQCRCLKDACVGHVWLSLHAAATNGPALSGEDTKLHVNWVPSGDLAQMTVEPF
jgi:hypothetical protein